MSAALKSTLLGLAALELAQPNGRETPEYKALQRIDEPCEICRQLDCTCCTGCIEISAQCDDCACDAPRELETQFDYEARSYGVRRSGPI